MIGLADAPSLTGTGGLSAAGSRLVRFPRRCNVSFLLRKFLQESSDVIDAGKIEGANERYAVNFLVWQLKRRGAWDWMSPIYGLCGGTALAHSINWRDPASHQIVWSGTVAHTASGSAGNGVNGSGNLNFNPITQGCNPGNFSFAIYKTAGPNGTAAFGSYAPGQETSAVHFSPTGIWGYIAGAYVGDGDFTSGGYFSSTIRSTNQKVTNINGKLSVSSGAPGTFLNSDFTILSRGAGAYSSSSVRFFALGEGRSNHLELAVGDLVREYQIILGRNLV